MKHTIYALLDPATQIICYVGVTKYPTRKRFLEHMALAQRGGPGRKSAWIRELTSVGLEPELVVLEETEEREACEKKWIACLRERGAALLNSTDGGNAFCGQVFSLEHRDKIGNALRGRKRPPHIAEMLSQVHKGKTLSVETRHKMSLSRRGKKQSEETRAKRRATLLGRPHSLQRRANISAARRKKVAQA